MERSMVWCTLALGCLGLFVGLLATTGGALSFKAFDRVEKSNRWMALLLPFLIFAITLPSLAPFAGGHGFGSGFLYGGLAAILSGYLLLRFQPNMRTFVSGTVILAPMWAGIVALSAVALGNRDILIDGFIGVAIGMLSVTFFLRQGLDETSDNAPVTIGMITGIGFTTSLAAAMALGEFHGTTMEIARQFSTAALELGTLVPFAALIGSIPGALLARPFMNNKVVASVAGATSSVVQSTFFQRRLEQIAQFLVSSAIVLSGSWFIQRHIDEDYFFKSILVGLFSFMAVWWLNSEADSNSKQTLTTAMHYRPLAILVVLGASMVTYAWLHNYGVCVALLPAWLVIAMIAIRQTSPITKSEEHRAFISLDDMLSPALFATILGLLRFVQVRFQSELKGVSIADQYAIFGFLVGMSAPWIFAEASSFRIVPGKLSVIAMIKLCTVGLAAVALPGVIIILWKSKAILALLGGLALSLSGFSPLSSQPLSARARQMSGLFALAMALAVSQWTHHALLINALTRSQKIHYLEYILLAVGGALIVTDIVGRVIANKEHSNLTVGKGTAR